MIGAIIGGALKIGSSIYGGIKAKKAAEKVKKNIEQSKAENKEWADGQNRDNQNWFDRRYNEDATQRADAQRMITKTTEALKQNNKAAAGSAAVMGGTDESVAAAKAASMQALADTTSQIVAQGEARKDSIEGQYLSRKDAIDEKYQSRNDAFNEQLNNIETNKAKSIADAVGGVADAAGGIAGNLSGAFAPQEDGNAV